MQEGCKVLCMMTFSLDQFSKVGHLEALISLVYNTRGVCSFMCVLFFFPFWAARSQSELFLSAPDLSICPRTLKLERMKVNKEIICLIPRGWTEAQINVLLFWSQPSCISTASKFRLSALGLLSSSCFYFPVVGTLLVPGLVFHRWDPDSSKPVGRSSCFLNKR